MNENGEGRVRKKLETIITKAAQQGKKFKRAQKQVQHKQTELDRQRWTETDREVKKVKTK